MVDGDALVRVVRAVLHSERNKWWTIPELAREVRRRTGRDVLDTSISARIRDLRRAPYNDWVNWRYREGRLAEYAVGVEGVTP